MLIINPPLKEWKGKKVLIYGPTYVSDSAVIGENTKICAHCSIGAEVEIGRGCNIQDGVFISNGVKVGDGVFFGPGCRVFNDKYINGLLQPPVIGNYSRIGGSTKILPGIRVGSNVFVGANSLITKNVPDGETVKGKW